MFRSIINYVKLLLVPTVEKPKAKRVCTNTSVRNRKHFDKSELAVLMNAELTHMEVASLLGRTVNAVALKRSKLRRNTK